ncbi:MAG: Asp-tRNA(Asn)/Glu-tRNA(Gln) amidotransferase subunit GatC [Bacteroidota bacterium]
MSIKIDNELIERLADLSQLDFEGEEKSAIKKDLQRMLDFVDQLREVPTEGVEPLIHMTPDANRLAADTPKNPLGREKTLSNSHTHDDQFFYVPKVLKK